MSIDERLCNSYLDEINEYRNYPDFDFLQSLHKKHITNFSFNNINLLLGEEISLDVIDIYEKIVTKGHGGYCFEQNKLFYEVLQNLGYDVRFVLGRVLSNRHIDAPRTHRVTILTFKEKYYLVDVGFGPMSPRGPLLLQDKYEETIGGVLFRIDQIGDNEYKVSNWFNDEFYTMYTFDLARYSEADCTVGNYYSYTHPKAVFLNNLVVSLITSERTLSLRNCSYFRISEEMTDKIEITDQAQLQEFLSADFGISITSDEAKTLFTVARNATVAQN